MKFYIVNIFSEQMLTSSEVLVSNDPIPEFKGYLETLIEEQYSLYYSIPCRLREKVFPYIKERSNGPHDELYVDSDDMITVEIKEIDPVALY